MAKTRYNIGLRLTGAQTILGFIYLPFYLVLTPWLLQFFAALLELPLDQMTLNILYFSVNLVFVLLVYHRWLVKSFRGFTEKFWLFIQTLILGFALYFGMNLVVTPLLDYIMGTHTTVNDEVVTGLFTQNRPVMLLFTVVAAPIVEEVLVRGVVFGTAHRKNRILAYVLSVLLFCIMHTWQYASSLTIPLLLANAAAYISPAVALGWTYEKSGTILCPILLHAIINGLTAGVTFFS